MRGIKHCGECAYYNIQTCKCAAGAKDIKSKTDPFYRDCPYDHVVPLYELFQLRDELYETDKITMKGIEIINQLLLKYMGDNNDV